MERLIDPLLEYNKLTKTKTIEKLDDAIRTILKSQTTLEFFTESYEHQKANLFDIINALTKDATKLSFFGETIYSKPNFKESFGTNNWYEYLIMSARTYQKIFELSQKLPDNVLDSDHKYMFLFMTMFEFHNSMQHSCSSSLVKDAEKILEHFQTNEKTITQSISFELHSVLLKFLASNFHSCKELGSKLYSNVKEVLGTNINLTRLEILDLGCILDILEALLLLIEFLLEGTTEKLEKSSKKAKDALELAQESGRPDLRYIVNKLKLSIQILGKLSIWNLRTHFDLKDAPKKAYLNKYILSKISGNFYFLYPSEHDALVEGILDQNMNAGLISMPTGSGKTLLAELIILSKVIYLWDKRELAIYMVPSRALAREKFKDLTDAFKPLGAPEIRVCQITGETILDAKRAVEEHDLVILTPEKLDMLLRNDYYKKKIDTLIIDEFHNMQSGYRGIKIEFDIIRHKELYPQTTIVLISAIVSNFTEIQHWLNSGTNFQTTWRPTFSRVGIFDIKNFETNGIKFTDGTSFIEPLSKKPRSNAHFIQAASLATKVVKDGPVMIFCGAKDDVLTVANYLMQEIGKNNNDLLLNIEQNEKLKLRLKRIIGEKEEIYQFFAKGIGIHRGDLPHIIRKIVEDGIRTNALQFIVSTTTLAEGINLPLKSIIIPKPKVGGDELSNGLFFNLAGRAGRPQKEIEGQVIFITSKSFPYSVLKEKYLKAEAKDIEAICTPLLHIFKLRKKIEQTQDSYWKQRCIEEIEIHKSVLDTALLAIVIENHMKKISDNPELINKIRIKSTDEVKIQVQKILEESEARLIEFKVLKNVQGNLKSTLFGEYVYKTGFSPLSCLKLLNHLSSLLPKLKVYTDNKRINPLDYDTVVTLFKLMEIPIETKSYFPKELPKNYAHILYKWMQGISIKTLANTSQFKNKISETMITVSALSGFSTWFMYAIYILIQYNSKVTKKRNKKFLFSLKLLPSYCWFGTLNIFAQKILQLDISRELLRDDVLLFVNNLKPSLIRKVMQNPDSIFTTEIQSEIKEMSLQFEESEFSKILNRILKKA